MSGSKKKKELKCFIPLTVTALELCLTLPDLAESQPGVQGVNKVIVYIREVGELICFTYDNL